MSIRKFDVSLVVEVVDSATAEERAQEDDIAPLVSALAVQAARQVLRSWERGDREYISIHVAEVS